MSEINDYDAKVESLTRKFSSFRLDKVEIEALAERIRLLQNQMATINGQLAALDPATKVEEYQEVTVRVDDVRDVSLDMFKTLPEFNGDRVKYSAWRNSAML